MKYFCRTLIGFALIFFGILAGLAFARGDIGLGIFDISLAIPTFINLIRDFDYI